MTRPTWTKAKLPAFLSYPLAWRSVESALGNTPQWENLHFYLPGHPGTSAVEFHRKVRASEPHVVLRACYERWDKRPSIGDDFHEYLQARWSLWLYPVSRQLRVRARAVLESCGLPTIVRWLTIKRPESWYWGRRSCTVVLDPVDATLRFEEDVEAG
jgi:hypothetical protein